MIHFPDGSAYPILIVVCVALGAWFLAAERHQELIAHHQVSEAVRRGNEENKRCALFAALEKQKSKLNALLFEAQRKKLGRKGNGENLSMDEILAIQQEEDDVALDEFSRHLWIETRGLVREVRQRFPFVTRHDDAINTAEHGAKSLGDVEILFSYLDDLSGQLLYTLEDVK